jgi:hypothetical protein
MKWFCPYCWAELKGYERICPNCGKDIYHFTSLDFDEKLLYGLDNPIPDNRMLVIEVIEKEKIKKLFLSFVVCYQKKETPTS